MLTREPNHSALIVDESEANSCVSYLPIDYNLPVPWTIDLVILIYIVIHVIDLPLNFYREEITDMVRTAGWAEDRSYTVYVYIDPWHWYAARPGVLRF